VSNQIYVFIGTKAQYIKTAPLLRLMQDRGVGYVLIDSGQHASLAPQLRRELGVKEPDVRLHSEGNITSVVEAARWFARYLLLLLRPAALRRRIFAHGDGTCVIHGDTPSTLLALLLAKRVGLRVAHIEAGLRSYNVLRPFPEELIRIICMRWSDVLFSPSDWAFDNLQRMKVRGQVVNVRHNTNMEAMHHALRQDAGAPTGAGSEERPFCLMTVHRVETILNRRRLEFVVELAESLSERMDVVFVLHDPTRKRLDDSGLMSRLTSRDAILTTGLLEHGAFLDRLANAEFAVTDGGSIQEESAYLGVPCLVMRRETERTEGLGQNVRLASFDHAEIDRFLAEYPSLRRPEQGHETSPSELILETLLEVSAS
jgi:UDP-N-acetylglucosamine 2-epimerase (non-hydrolysing)